MSNIFYFKGDYSFCASDFGDQLFSLTRCYSTDSILFLCIGSDRSTGDSLGPLVGYKLKKLNLPNCKIIGTIDTPVHAANLHRIYNYITSYYNHSTVIVVDAAMGNHNNIGYITLNKGPLKPGLGVEKELPAIGDISITGIVSSDSKFHSIMLQNTRLSMVMNLSDLIVAGIYHFFSNLF